MEAVEEIGSSLSCWRKCLLIREQMRFSPRGLKSVEGGKIK